MVSQIISQRISDSQIAVIANAGHMPQLDQPEVVAAVVNPLL
jgi:pimeloyl-ACP methyl ester carboxylesterase